MVRLKKYIFLLILITALVYLNALKNGFVWDDLNNIVNNDMLSGPVELKDIILNLTGPQLFYRPIPYLTIVFDHWLWKKNPFGYHLSNVLFHLLNVILIFHIARKFTSHSFLPFICALLFAIHPIHTEAITYISGRSDPILCFFILFSSLLYIKFLETDTGKKRVYLLSSLCLFLLALFSKELALIFPFACFLLDMHFLRSPFRMRIKRSLLFLFLAAAFLLFRYFFIKHPALDINIDRLHLFPQIILYYLKALIFPFNLHMQPILVENIFLAIIIIGICILLISRLTKNKTLVFAGGWFLLWLLPFSGILRLNCDVAAHWLYIASFGFFLIAGHYLLRNKMALTMVLLFLGIQTIQRNFIWNSDISIYKDTLKYRPNDYKLHYNLGNAYLRRGMLSESHQEYNIALKINPTHAYTLNNLRLIFDKLGASFAFAEGEASFDHSLYAEVLKTHLKDGNIDYKALKEDSSRLDDYLENVAELDAQAFISMSEKGRMAFYLNVYNAITLKVIIENYPVKSIRDIPGVWDKRKAKVAGRDLTLNQIEHEILRKEFREPRIHFALVCASKGCPKLAKEPFNGKDLNEQLDREASRFINDKTKVKLDKDNNVLYLSSIFKWFKEDFGDVIEFIDKYLSESDVEFIKKKKPKIKYINYDWSLNEKL